MISTHTYRSIAIGLILLVIAGSAPLLAAIDGQALSPGAYPAPDVEEAPLALAHARPNFANRNELSSFIDGVIRAYMKRDHIAGAAIAIVHHDEVLLLKGYGTAGNGRTVNASSTLFRLGSMARVFSWTALMQLEEAGHISLDDPVNARLPQNLTMPEHLTGPILIRHLMDYKTGLEALAPYRPVTTQPNRLLSSDKALIRYRPKQVRAAGLYTTMTDYDAALAGAVITHVTGRNFPAYIEDNIFTPLGMSASSFREPMDPDIAKVRGLPSPMPQYMAQHLSQGFRVANNKAEPQPFHYQSSLAPALALSSTAQDMTRFMRAWLHDGQFQNARILRPETVKRMRAPLSKTADLRLPTIRHGFIDYLLPNGYRGYGHTGEMTYFRSNMVLVPRLGLGIFIATNSESGDRLAMALPDLLIAHFFPTDDTIDRPAPQPNSAGTKQLIDGSYLSLQRPFTGPAVFFAAINNSYDVQHGAQNELIITGKGHIKRYRLLSPGLYAETDGPSRIGFRQNKDGAQTYMTTSLGTETLERTPYIRQPRIVFHLMAGMIFIALALLTDSLVRRRTDNSFPYEKISRYLTPLFALSWLLYCGVLFVTATNLTAGTSHPDPETIEKSVALLRAAGLPALLFTLLFMPIVWLIWRHESHRFWWRRTGQTLAVINALCFLAMLHHWSLIGL